MKRFFILICILQQACSQEETSKPVVYTGPIQQAEDVESYYTEDQKLKIKLKAPKISEFENGDQDFPEGMELEFYNEDEEVKSTIRANSAHYFKEDNQWRGRGNVEVKNLEKNEELNTEELFWKQDTKRIFTDKFVTIRTEDMLLTGRGLEAPDDMSSYTIKNPEGEFEIPD